MPGLNLFYKQSLMAEKLEALKKYCDQGFTHLLMFGHAGKRLWEAVEDKIGDVLEPIDTYSIEAISHFIESSYPDCRFKFLYPGDALGVSLRDLGKAAGWHQDSAIGLGIHPVWGTWFAYRAVVLVDEHFKMPDTPPVENQSPCGFCIDKPCVSACPAGALEYSAVDKIKTCSRYRVKEDSLCHSTCLARVACPAGKEHQYSDAQLSYHYDVSLRTIRAYLAGLK
jgi:ferredoxin